MNRAVRLCGYAWLALLGAALCCSALMTDRRALQTEEYAFGCDSFGYLQSAQQIRRANLRSWPHFELEAPHSRLLIEFMQSRNVPLGKWEEIVAPHAHHYFPKSDQIGVQYPPGTGLLLAIFPPGQALHRLDRLVISVFLATGLIALILAALRQAWFSAGLVTLALQFGLEILGRIGNASFSINAVLTPLLLTSVCLIWVLGPQKDRGPRRIVQSVGAFFGGLFFGFAVLVRLPVLLFFPGIVLLLWPSRSWANTRLIAFALGLLLGGILPLVAVQQRLVGAWYLPTYGSNDAAPPTLSGLKTNASFYLGGGSGSTDNLVLVAVGVCCIALLWSGWPAKTQYSASLTRGRLLLAALLMWVVATAYFLTHQIAIHFYPIPATFTIVLLLALGAFRIELTSDRVIGKNLSTLRVIALLLVMIAPGVMVGRSVWRTYTPAARVAWPRPFLLPPELAEEHAWIWSDMLSGTLWYYNHKAAHKLQFTVPETRALVFEFVFRRGEPQYLIRDSDGMQNLLDEITALGGAFENRGEVDGYPYFLIHWPASGPGKGGGAHK